MGRSDTPSSATHGELSLPLCFWIVEVELSVLMYQMSGGIVFAVYERLVGVMTAL